MVPFSYYNVHRVIESNFLPLCFVISRPGFGSWNMMNHVVESTSLDSNQR